jgi:nicotinamidase-related amidase
MRQGVGGARPDLVEPIVAEAGRPFLETMRHSAFHATSLEYLPRRLKTKSIILTAQLTEQRILYTALDTYLRHFDVTVPSTPNSATPRCGCCRATCSSGVRNAAFAPAWHPLRRGAPPRRQIC